MRTSPGALLVASIGSIILILLLTLPLPAQATGTLPVSLFASDRGAGRSAPPLASPTEAQHLLELINQARWEMGQLPPLKWNAALERAAVGHSQHMAQENFFGHKGADLSSPWDRIDAAGYGNWYVLAENIAVGYQSGADVVQAWLESPQHRENLLNPELSEAGIGYVFEETDTYPGTTWGYRHYWTLDMGSRWDAYPLVIAGEAFSTTLRTVPLYLYGDDWATEMRLSNDGVNWSAWMPYKATLAWKLLPGNGIQHVYGELRNAQGTVMQAEDEIVLAEPLTPTVRPAQPFFVLVQGQDTGRPPRYRVQITDPTGGTHHWYATWDQDWLRLSTSGEGVPGGIYLILTEEASLLPPGFYTATLLFADGTVQVSVPVRLAVFPQVFSAYFPLISK